MAAEAACSNYLIVKNILSHLRWRDLKICKSVSQLWKDVAESMPIRTAVVDANTDESVETYYAGHENSKSAKIHVEGRLRTKPSFTLLFIAEPMVRGCKFFPTSCFNPFCSKHCKPPWKFMREDFSDPNSDILAVYTTNFNESVIHRNAVEPIFSGMSFPTIDGVSVQKLTLTDMTSQEVDFWMARLLETDIIKCILIFSNGLLDVYLIFLKRQIRRIIERQGPKHPISIGGSTAHYMSDRIFGWEAPMEDQIHCTTLVIFSVAKSAQNLIKFESYSTMYSSMDVGELKFKQLSRIIANRQHSLALQFNHTEDDLEKFIQYFPSTPMIGIYARAAAGYARKNRRETVFFPFCNSLVLLAWDDN